MAAGRTCRRPGAGRLWRKQYRHRHVPQRQRRNGRERHLDAAWEHLDGGGERVPGGHLASSAGEQLVGRPAPPEGEPRTENDGLRARNRESIDARTECEVPFGADLRKSGEPRRGHAAQSRAGSMRGTRWRVAHSRRRIQAASARHLPCPLPVTPNLERERGPSATAGARARARLPQRPHLRPPRRRLLRPRPRRATRARALHPCRQTA